MEGTHRIRTQGWYGWFAVNMNDYYFKHIVNNVMYYVQPTHIFVLGKYHPVTLISLLLY